MPFPVLIHRYTRRTLILYEDVTITPGLILVGNGIVLQETHPFAFVKGGFLAPGIVDDEPGFVFQYLV